MKSRAFAASFRLAPLLVLSGLLSIVHPEVSSANPHPVAIEQPSIESALVGRTWQLVRIMSMDDTESVPDEVVLGSICFRHCSEATQECLTRLPSAAAVQ